MLGTYCEKAITEASTVSEIEAHDFIGYDLSHEVLTRLAEITLNEFLVDRVVTLLESQDLSKPYRDGAVDTEEFTKFKILISGARNVGNLVAGMESLANYAKFKVLLEHGELALQLYEEIKPKVLRLPVLIALAKRIEQVPVLKALQAHKNFIAAVTVAKGKLAMLLEDFKQFSVELDRHIAANDIKAVQNCKILNSRLLEYRADIPENSLAFRVVESMLLDMHVMEAERVKERPLKLDFFLVVLKRELKSLLRAGESEIAAEWQEKRHLFEESKVVIQKVQKLKTELPQWREVTELAEPETVLATKREVDRLLEESEDSVLVMNSMAVKKLADLKNSSIKFDRRNSTDHWSSFESSKRHMFNIMKSGALFGDDVLKVIKELRIHAPDSQVLQPQGNVQPARDRRPTGQVRAEVREGHLRQSRAACRRGQVVPQPSSEDTGQARLVDRLSLGGVPSTLPKVNGLQNKAA